MITVLREGAPFDGVVKYQVQYPNNGRLVNNDPFDADNFYPFSGYGGDCNYSNSIGTIVKNVRKRKNLKAEAKAKAKVLKAGAKSTQANAQLKSASTAGTTKNDVELAKALNTTPKKTVEKDGMSTGVKVGIGLGVTAIVATVIYFVVKHKKGK